MGAEPIPVSILRGGTSKGVFLRLTDLPRDPAARDRLALALLGSPDPMQLDGLGGTHSSTSKLMVVGRPADAARLGLAVPGDADVVSLFAQVAVDRPIVDWRGDCGNLTAAVASYAVHEGIVRGADPVTELRLCSLNTGVRITCRIPTSAGRPVETGDFAIPGVPGTGARIDLVFHDPASAPTGRVLPTGRPLDELRVGGRRIEATILDVTNPVVVVRAEDVGRRGAELPAELNADAGLLALIEAIRGAGAELCGLAAAADAATTSPAVPRVILVAPPMDHTVVGGATIAEADADFVVRTSSMGVVHHAFTGTGLMAAAAAAALPGTVFDRVGGIRPDGVRLAHPKGVVPLTADVVPGDPQPVVRSVGMSRTARLLMSGLAHPRPAGPGAAVASD